MHVRARLQLAEALGPDNRWYCSQAHGRRIDDEEQLLIYFIRSGGAADFAARYANALSRDNRWYCSQYYGYDVRDPDILWDYFNRSVAADVGSRNLTLTF